MTNTSIVSTAKLLSSQVRVDILCALSDMWPKNQMSHEIALRVGVRPSVASHHLRKLVAGDLVIDLHVGNKVYFKFCTNAFQHQVEQIQALSRGV